MKDKRNKRRSSDPEYIDLFAEEEEDAVEVEALFGDGTEEAPVSRTPKKKDKPGRDHKEKKKKTRSAPPEEEEPDCFLRDAREETPDRDFPEEEFEDEFIAEDLEEEPPEESGKRKRSARKDKAGAAPGKKPGLIARAVALLRGEDDEEDEDEDKDEDLDDFAFSEDEAPEDAPAAPREKRRKQPPEEREPVITPVRQPGEDDEDWDIGGDFTDPFETVDWDTPKTAGTEAPEEEPLFGGDEETPAAGKKPEDGEDKPFFSFDRYGRRKNRGARASMYGRRKNIPKASPVVVTRKTDAMREMEEAQQRAEKRNLIRDRELEKRRTENRARILRELKHRLNTAAMLAALGVLVVLAGFFAFRVTAIDVTGSYRRYTAEEIVSISGLAKGKHILLQSLSDAEDRLNKDPYLSASVKYVFPNRITVTVRERRGIGVVQWGPNSEYMALIDSDGNILETNLENRSGLPLVRGLVVTRVIAGSKIGDDADEQVQSTLDLLRSLDEYGLLLSINSLDMSETMGISMYTPENYRIEVGSVADLDTKLTRLKKNWSAIMSQAAAYRSDNVTVYLYSKNGVIISPHDVGYEVPREEELTVPVAVVAEAQPFTAFGTVMTTPEPTPEPIATPPPFNNGPFSG